MKFKNVNRKTYVALCGSVDKWWRISFAGAYSQGRGDCALCREQSSQKGSDHPCTGCPVWQVTGHFDCGNTAMLFHTAAVRGYGRGSPPALAWARKFYYWLQALRDEYRDQLEEEAVEAYVRKEVAGRVDARIAELLVTGK